ncbi:MAG TPA: PH domain-containing protein [Symbiobacteriaceae bacterium]|nr:PH domain-containing protein [Symbiobacteriaceae bacterium]
MTFHPANPRSARWLWILVALVVLITLVPVSLMARTLVGASNLRYELTQSDLVIHFTGAPTQIDRSAIIEVQVYDDLTDARRLMGTAMPGLYEGRWTSKETGRITLFASATDRMVVVKTAERAWGITPADPAAFADALKSGQTGRWEPVRGQRPTLLMGAFVLFILLTVGGASAILIYYMRLPGTIRYHLTDDGVIIEGGRLRVVLPYREITRAEVVSPRGYPWRTFGAHLPGLVWGRFSWKGLPGRLRIYATQVKPLVAVTAGAVTYGISPAERDRFLAELQKHI